MSGATRIAELFGASTRAVHGWRTTAEEQTFPFVDSKCFKVRRSRARRRGDRPRAMPSFGRHEVAAELTAAVRAERG